MLNSNSWWLVWKHLSNLYLSQWSHCAWNHFHHCQGDINPYWTFTVNLASKSVMFENHNVIVIPPTLVVKQLKHWSFKHMVTSSIPACDHLFLVVRSHIEPFHCSISELFPVTVLAHVHTVECDSNWKYTCTSDSWVWHITIENGVSTCKDTVHALCCKFTSIWG